jgi:hypothetical protein
VFVSAFAKTGQITAWRFRVPANPLPHPFLSVENTLSRKHLRRTQAIAKNRPAHALQTHPFHTTSNRSQHPMISHTSRLHPAPLDTPADLAELETGINDLPAELRLQIQPVFDRVKQSTLRRRQILQLVQDALSQLRLDMKYLMFDLEATRRERDEFRRQLEEIQG